MKRVWGPWSYDPKTFFLEGRFPREGAHPHEYGVYLEECCDSAGVLGWIAQFAGKTWTTPEQIGYLVLALDDLLGLQKNICGGATDHRIEPIQVVSERM